ncbi:hypothetical protein FRB99_001667 [Tulasnella sp. 403]|nr:hypothetical protein FRB99_001667 [Tulasnella sp. 403]
MDRSVRFSTTSSSTAFSSSAFDPSLVNNSPSGNAPDWHQKYIETKAVLDDALSQLDELRTSSTELETELERELEMSESARRQLEEQVARLERDREESNVKYKSANDLITKLQDELLSQSTIIAGFRTQLVELELTNDHLERGERTVTSTLKDLEGQHATLLEEKILLEGELSRRLEENQRLKDELHDTLSELHVAQKTRDDSKFHASSAAASILSALPHPYRPSPSPQSHSIYGSKFIEDRDGNPHASSLGGNSSTVHSISKLGTTSSGTSQPLRTSTPLLLQPDIISASFTGGYICTTANDARLAQAEPNLVPPETAQNEPSITRKISTNPSVAPTGCPRPPRFPETTPDVTIPSQDTMHLRDSRPRTSSTRLARARLNSRLKEIWKPTREEKAGATIVPAPVAPSVFVGPESYGNPSPDDIVDGDIRSIEGGEPQKGPFAKRATSSGEGKPAIHRRYLVSLAPLQDYYEALEEAIQGGVTVVQVREKTADTREFFEVANRSKAICDKYNVPLIINDRIDIALAIKADGVHVGQDDMSLEVARSLLGPDAIIGVSTGTVAEAHAAISGGADYVGIGAVYPTGSKSNAKLLGVRGVGPILSALEDTPVKAVVIGGITSVNLLRTLHGAVSPNGKHVDGIAVISEIVAAPDPKAAAGHLREILRSFFNAGTSGPSPPLLIPTQATPGITPETLRTASGDLLAVVRKYAPMVHQLTNDVVVNQSANATLALGASPIMATAVEEQEDLAKIPGGLLVNMGTITDKDGMLAAGRWANYNKKPVVFDPVGVGATQFRKTSANELLNAWQATVIKGNAGEIATLLGTGEVESRGVDSVGAGFSDPATAVRTLARRERNIIVLTGKDDYISDGSIVVKLSNGHELLGQITGSGCMVGTAIATFCGAASIDAAHAPNTHAFAGRLVCGDMLAAAVAAVLAVTVAGELAAKNEKVVGPASFLAQLIDELYNLTPEKLIQMANVEVLS